MTNVLRQCARCDEWYAAGTYAVHRRLHTPIRTNTAGPPPSDHTTVRATYALTGSYAETGRRTGLSRQRVHQIIRADR